MKYGQWIAMCSNLSMLCFEQLHFMIKDMSIRNVRMSFLIYACNLVNN